MIAALSLLIWFSSCAESRALPPEHADLIAWYIEDVAHGNVRKSDELVLTPSSDAMERVATWLAGGMVRDQHIPPRQVASRRERWPALKALYLQGLVVVLDDGLVAATPTLAKEDQAYVLPVIDSENLDRRSINALVISMVQADRNEASLWLARSATARIALDTQAGAKRWVGKY